MSTLLELTWWVREKICKQVDRVLESKVLLRKIKQEEGTECMVGGEQGKQQVQRD